MATPRIDPAEAVSELGGLSTGLGIISMTLFPFAIPGLLLVLPVVVLMIPLAMIGLIGYLAYRLLMLPFRLARAGLRDRSRDDDAAPRQARPLRPA
jgi:hypothetical protein